MNGGEDEEKDLHTIYPTFLKLDKSNNSDNKVNCLDL